jgi:subtilisin family serine protease
VGAGTGGRAGCIDGDCDDALAYFSNFGVVVDVTAPGSRIASTWPGGGYATLSGTSMAAPHVAGVAALVLAETSSLSPAEARALLEATECQSGGRQPDRRLPRKRPVDTTGDGTASRS